MSLVILTSSLMDIQKIIKSEEKEFQRSILSKSDQNLSHELDFIDIL